ncbi:citrate transporter [Pseudoscourfieldia marina]
MRGPDSHASYSRGAHDVLMGGGVSSGISAASTETEEMRDKVRSNHCEDGLNSGDPMCVDPHAERPDLTETYSGACALALFVVAYLLALMEDVLGHAFRKCIPVCISSGFIWVTIATQYRHTNASVAAAVRHNLLEFGEIFLFLVAAMTYVATLEALGAFEWLRNYLMDRGYGLRAMFWITGGLTFVLSPVADNLTAALLMGAVAGAVGQGNERFISVSCVNIVVASNAGGVFSPFGDITTLMIWQKGKLNMVDFMELIVPALINWLIPAFILSYYAVADGHSASCHSGSDDGLRVPTFGGGGKPSAAVRQAIYVVCGLFAFTISITVWFHAYLHLPPVIGMMSGLGLLQLYGYFAALASGKSTGNGKPVDDSKEKLANALDTFKRLASIEWDTLLFFYGVILGVGGLGACGFLEMASRWGYGGFGPTTANVGVGFLSAIVDNIPVVFAVLEAEPPMNRAGWLLLTLTAGVGGSMLSLGSAAGVGLMGQARGTYTFRSHLKWSWAVAIGYAGSICAMLILHGQHM